MPPPPWVGRGGTSKLGLRTADWVVEQGVRWQPSLGGTLSLGRTNSFFLGGGRAMLNALYLTAEKLGVEIAYDAEVTDLQIEDGMFSGVNLKQPVNGAT